MYHYLLISQQLQKLVMPLLILLQFEPIEVGPNANILM